MWLADDVVRRVVLHVGSRCGGRNGSDERAAVVEDATPAEGGRSGVVGNGRLGHGERGGVICAVVVNTAAVTRGVAGNAGGVGERERGAGPESEVVDATAAGVGGVEVAYFSGK